MFDLLMNYFMKNFDIWVFFFFSFLEEKVLSFVNRALRKILMSLFMKNVKSG